jgi:hypothetical protein
VLPRETESDMLHFRWRGFRESDGEEFRLNIKLLPIRMYIDQDSLLFLVSYFQSESTEDPNTPAGTVSDTVFFRSCQVEPISVKVDYKAKHIDYSSIKDGKYAEFLNFVSLDGAALYLPTVKLEGFETSDFRRNWLEEAV